MSLSTYPCPACGAKLEFVPGAAALACPYCGHQAAVPAAAAPVTADAFVEQDLRAALASTRATAETVERHEVRCDGCGAQVTLEEHLAASTCPFCTRPLVAEAVVHRIIRPQSLLPFAVERPRAAGLFRDWLAGLWFAPGDLKHAAGTEAKLSGLYIPAWTYDADTESDYAGERGDDYWETEHYTTRENGRIVSRTRQVRRTRWRSVSGRVRRDFDDVLVLATDSLPAAEAAALEPWDLAALVPYADGYLAGFRAETYRIDLEQGFVRAQEIMQEGIRRDVCADIGGDHQRIHQLSTRYGATSFKHILLPVWISSYRHGAKIYRFLVNARTGEVQGERPWSAWKIGCAVFAALAALGLVLAVLHAS